jgi:hypothetical protein
VPPAGPPQRGEQFPVLSRMVRRLAEGPPLPKTPGKTPLPQSRSAPAAPLRDADDPSRARSCSVPVREAQDTEPGMVSRLGLLMGDARREDICERRFRPTAIPAPKRGPSPIQGPRSPQNSPEARQNRRRLQSRAAPNAMPIARNNTISPHLSPRYSHRLKVPSPPSNALGTPCMVPRTRLLPGYLRVDLSGNPPEIRPLQRPPRRPDSGFTPFRLSQPSQPYLPLPVPSPSPGTVLAFVVGILTSGS